MKCENPLCDGAVQFRAKPASPDAAWEAERLQWLFACSEHIANVLWYVQTMDTNPTRQVLVESSSW